MRSQRAHRLALAALMLLAAGVFCLGINWGLPSRASDRFLFGDRPVWSGAEIVRLAPAKTEGGADVDVNPIVDRSQFIELNQTDAQRAEIVRRYRLFSHQPDEMITFSSLSRIRQFKGDPRLYQYGGLWVYPVGVMLKLASVVGFVELKSDQAFYLDHPEAFGRFYVVARFYSAMWGVVGVWAVYQIARKLSANAWGPVLAGVAFIFLPVVVNMAHEAKPHLGGAVLQLLAILSAMHFVGTRRERWFWVSAALCGAAFGMVISSLWVFVILPVARVMVEPVKRAFVPTLLGGLLGAAVYCVTNPYVPINLVRAPELIFSNIGNSTAMYRVADVLGGLVNTVRLIGEGTTIPLALVGVLGLIMLVFRGRGSGRAETSLEGTDRQETGPPGRIIWILVAAMVPVVLQMILLGAGKPAEYGRFALLPDVVLAIAGVVVLANLKIAGRILCVGLVGWTVIAGSIYVRSFVRDCVKEHSRYCEAERNFYRFESGGIGLPREPAPYNCPPVDLFQTRLFLLPSNHDLRPAGPVDMIIYPDESLHPSDLRKTPMSWANKDFVIVSK